MPNDFLGRRAHLSRWTQGIGVPANRARRDDQTYHTLPTRAPTPEEGGSPGAEERSRSQRFGIKKNDAIASSQCAGDKTIGRTDEI